MTHKRKRRIGVLGASGTVGRRIVDRLLEGGFDVVCQTRSAAKLADLAGRAAIHTFDPRHADGLSRFVSGADAVIFALGTDNPGATTLFSESTAALIKAMQKHGVSRLIAITGVGAGETRGHGGWLYDWIIFPLFTRKRYLDKNKQEDLIAASDLDWTIVRPARFTDRPAAAGALQMLTVIDPETRLSRITRDEVAAFVVAQLDSDKFVRQRPFVGHA
ncbi:MAG: NAD(P)-dependent oxidoreductase [Aestuariivirga sp.]